MKMQQRFAAEISSALGARWTNGSPPNSFVESLSSKLVGIVQEEMPVRFARVQQEARSDSELLKASGYNAGVYREALAMACTWARCQVERRDAPANVNPPIADYSRATIEVTESKSEPPAVRDMAPPLEELKLAAGEYATTPNVGKQLHDKLKVLRRAALVFAADELEQLHDRSPHLPVLVAICNLYRLALGLS